MLFGAADHILYNHDNITADKKQEYFHIQGDKHLKLWNIPWEHLLNLKRYQAKCAGGHTHIIIHSSQHTCELTLCSYMMFTHSAFE